MYPQAESLLGGISEAWVATDVDNDAANELYRSLGSQADPALIHVFTL